MPYFLFIHLLCAIMYFNGISAADVIIYFCVRLNCNIFHVKTRNISFQILRSVRTLYEVRSGSITREKHIHGSRNCQQSTHCPLTGRICLFLDQPIRWQNLFTITITMNTFFTQSPRRQGGCESRNNISLVLCVTFFTDIEGIPRDIGRQKLGAWKCHGRNTDKD